MKIRLFPNGGVHSAYLDMIDNPPEGIEYVGEHSYAPGSAFKVGGRGLISWVLDALDLPYVVPLNSDYFVHSCQKLIHTNADFVIDTEHGNPFMGSDNINKHKSALFRSLVSKILLKDNCKGVLPWSEKAAGAFCMNFDFLGDRFLTEKVIVARPTTIPCRSMTKKFDKFTFLFIGGYSFYAKGGLQTLAAFNHLVDLGHDAELIMVGDVPEHLKMKYNDVKGVWFYTRLQRTTLLDLMSKCHCLVQPSVGDTYGMSLLEAKARGVPAIVVDSFAEAELVENGKSGMVLKPDMNLKLRFDNYGRKILSKDAFHSQFRSYNPSFKHVYDLMHTMKNLVLNPNTASVMGEEAFKEIDGGRLSIAKRNEALKKVYEGGL